MEMTQAIRDRIVADWHILFLIGIPRRSPGDDVDSVDTAIPDFAKHGF
jgi:hypothetical protein